MFKDNRKGYDDLVKRLYGEGRKAIVEVGVFASAGAVKHDARVLEAKRGIDAALKKGTISKTSAAQALSAVSANPAAWAEIKGSIKQLASKIAKDKKAAQFGQRYKRLKKGLANASKRFRNALKKAKRVGARAVRATTRAAKKTKIVRSITKKLRGPKQPRAPKEPRPKREPGKTKKERELEREEKGGFPLEHDNRPAKEPSARGLTVLDVAIWNEFGAGHVPMRSFLRGFFDEQRPQNTKLASNLMQSVVKGSRTQGQVLNLLGVKFVGEIQRRMARGIPPPNAAVTVKRKHSTKPLIDTGQLRSSIAYRATWGTEVIGGTRD